MSALRDIERLLNKVLRILFQCFPGLTIRKFSQGLTQICLQQCKPTAFILSMMAMENGLFPPSLQQPFMYVLADCQHSPSHLLFPGLDNML